MTLRKLIIPPLGMSTGLCMFIAPETRVPWSWALGAFLLGALVFSVPLARSSKLIREGDTMLMKRSWIEVYWSQLQTGALVFLLALGAVVRWRLALVMEFKKLTASRAS